jgi:hypothetical protein
LKRLQDLEYTESQSNTLIVANNTTINYDLRAQTIDWIYDTVIKANIVDKNVFFESIKLLDLYYTHRPGELQKDTL